MNLYFLPSKLKIALSNLNLNYLSEIRIRKGQAVIIEYRGEYKYINSFGIAENREKSITVDDVEGILLSAMHGSVYAYTEQIKSGFITVDGGIRIGIAGEYVTENGKITAVRDATSLNIRLPHDVDNCSYEIYEKLLKHKVANTLIFSPPGYGKTTVLRDIAKRLSTETNLNVLVFDERNEISGYGEGVSFPLGDRVDVVRGAEKLAAFTNAIRAMKPQVIITDELYGENDLKAIKFATDCCITVIASSHVCDKEILKAMPFIYYVELTGIAKKPIIYDKNFCIISDNSPDDGGGRAAVRR